MKSEEITEIGHRLDLWLNGDHAALETLIDPGPGAQAQPVFVLDIADLLGYLELAFEEIDHLTAELRVAKHLDG